MSALKPHRLLLETTRSTVPPKAPSTWSPSELRMSKDLPARSKYSHRVAALEFGPHQVRVNAVNPTVTMTEMGKVKFVFDLFAKICLIRFVLQYLSGNIFLTNLQSAN